MAGGFSKGRGRRGSASGISCFLAYLDESVRPGLGIPKSQLCSQFSPGPFSLLQLPWLPFTSL